MSGLALKKLLISAAFSALLLSAGASLATQPDAGTAAPTAAPDLSEQTMKDVTRQLASDEFEGRAPGTAGEEKTKALLTQKFAAAGLKPGNDGSWFQEVPLIEITASDFSPLTVSGGTEPLSYDFGKDYVAVTYRETPAIDVANSEMVFVGYGVNAPERGWNDYEGVDVKGKTVVILVNDPDFGTESLEGDFGGRAMTYYGRWAYKYEEAARQGAAAALIIHDTAPVAYGWNVVESSWSGPQYLAQSDDKGADQTMANGWIQKNVATEIFAAAGQDLDAMMTAARRPDFQAVPLGLSASLSFQNEFERTVSDNVIGILPGAERPDEYVLYTAHWDHLGRCKAAPDGDDICNGAVDNATGTAALVALAEAHAEAGTPDRSIIFLAVTAEESGLLGSQYYADNPVYPLARTVGGVNMDAFSMAGPASNLTVIGMGKSDLDAYLAKAAEAEGRMPEREPTPEKGYYYRSDHFSLAKKGVPMAYFKGGEDLIEGGREAGKAAAADYTDNHYHGPKDEFDENWDWSGVMADLKLYYRMGRALAMSSDWPNWNEGDEFRALRDETADQRTLAR
jgi:Zn-dependent M28 family amino/carboxypeptidase|tara:strand:+ start:8180 stop:9880 length:1701 start_codon:yes stop_codon:yes gene_type:complete